MEILTIEIKDSKAYQLLQSLEALNIIKVIKKSTAKNSDLAEKYAGKLPYEVAEKLENYVNESRSEWNRGDI
jgi:hypothetical protein